MDSFSVFADAVFPRLVWTSIQAAVLIAALWWIGRRIPRLSPAMRCMMRWLVALQLLLGLLLAKPVELPLLAPPSALSDVTHVAVAHRDRTEIVQPIETTTVASPVVAATHAPQPRRCHGAKRWWRCGCSAWRCNCCSPCVNGAKRAT